VNEKIDNKNGFQIEFAKKTKARAVLNKKPSERS